MEFHYGPFGLYDRALANILLIILVLYPPIYRLKHHHWNQLNHHHKKEKRKDKIKSAKEYFWDIVELYSFQICGVIFLISNVLVIWWVPYIFLKPWLLQLLFIIKSQFFVNADMISVCYLMPSRPRLPIIQNVSVGVWS